MHWYLSSLPGKLSLSVPHILPWFKLCLASFLSSPSRSPLSFPALTSFLLHLSVHLFLTLVGNIWNWNICSENSRTSLCIIVETRWRQQALVTGWGKSTPCPTIWGKPSERVSDFPAPRTACSESSGRRLCSTWEVAQWECAEDGKRKVTTALKKAYTRAKACHLKVFVAEV